MLRKTSPKKDLEKESLPSRRLRYPTKREKEKNIDPKWVLLAVMGYVIVSRRIRVLPKGWFPKATWQKPQQRICFSGHLHGYGTGSIEALERRWWLSGVVGDCVFFLKISQVERMYNDRILQCLDCFFKCWESIKKTQLTVELLNCWKPTSLKWFVFSEKLRKLPGQLLIYKVMRATSPKANSCGC